MARPRIIQEYQPVVRTRNSQGFSACALVGIHSILLGWNMDESIDRKEFMGFAVNRSEFDPETGELLRKFWLNGNKRFKGARGDIGFDVRSDQGPFQRFRWSDYTVDPSRSYSYELIPMFGKPNNLKRSKSLFLNIRPTNHFSNGLGVYANRGVTAAYAYLQRFGNKKPEDVADSAALIWLSRGLKESLLNFISKAKEGDNLDVAIYEFHDDDVAKALKAAQESGVNLRIVYDGGKQKSKKRNEHLLDLYDLQDFSFERSNISISHNKFVILSSRGVPVSVWTGTCNFSPNAFYKQTNQAVIFENNSVARYYLEYFNILSKDFERSKWLYKQNSAQFKIEKLNARIEDENSSLDLSFSPTSKKHVIEEVIEAISQAKSAILVSSPFSLDKSIIQALVANKNVILEYGLVNATAKNKIGMLKNNNSRFFHPTRLKTYMGTSWDAKAFGAHKIHTKSIVIDPWSRNPTTVFGSANFSDNSSRNNDENMFITNDNRFAAITATEFIRMYDHYRSRYFINEIFKGKSKTMYLNEDGNDWTRTAFDSRSSSFKYRDRLVFSGYV